VSEAPGTRGKAALAAGRYDEAVRLLGEAAQQSPRDDDAHYHHALALLWRGLPADALVALDPCIALRGPKLAVALELAVLIRRQLGLPVHGQMILPGAPPVAMSTAPVSPMTTLTGTGPAPFEAAAERIRNARRSK
jgi:hypothetical protein